MRGTLGAGKAATRPASERAGVFAKPRPAGARRAAFPLAAFRVPCYRPRAMRGWTRFRERVRRLVAPRARRTRAIVLSCDRYAPMAAHMVRTYRTLWPDHPFVFRIPYQDAASWPRAWRDPAIELVPSPGGIVATIETLLRDLPDEEWVYWCIDDKFLIDLDVVAVARLHRWLVALDDPAVSGLIFCRCRMLLHEDHVRESGGATTPDGEHLLARVDYFQFWIHQYLRVRVLRDAFRRFPGEPARAKQMDAWIGQEPGMEIWKIPDDEIRYVTARNLAVFGESTDAGRLLSACAASMDRLGITPPAFERVDADVRMGAPLA